jgi:hypothetical protein
VERDARPNGGSRERALEEYVRDMARRWALVPDPDEAEPGSSLPKA